MPVTTAQPVSPQLLSALHGEQLLWAGRPDPAVWFSRSDWYLIPASLLWLGFVVFWNFGVRRSAAPAAFLVFGLIFLAVGLYFAVGRFLVKRQRKIRSEYALTRSRAIVFDRRTVRDIPLAHTPIEISLSRDRGHLSVTFGTGVGPARFGMGFGFGGRAPANSGLDLFPTSGSAGFYDVADVTGLQAALALVDGH